MHLLLRLFFLVMLLASCSPEKKAVSLDESNLESVLTFFYHPGSRSSDAVAMYKLLSAVSRAQVPQIQWEDAVAAQTGIITSVSVVKKEVAQGVTYGIVSLSESVNGATSISTATWVLEDNKWRRIKLPLSMDKVNRAFSKNDFGAAKTAAKKWLAQDPFSTQAYETLIFCTERSDDMAPDARDRQIASFVNKMLSINPNDTRTLLLAVSHAKDVASAKPYLKRLEGTVSYKPAVDVLAGKAGIPGGDLEAQTPDGDLSLIQKLIVLAELGELQEFTKLGSDDRTNDRLGAYLAEREPDDAAEYAGRLGIAYHQAGLNKQAAQWLAFGKERDPGNDRLRRLEALLAKNKQR